LASLTKYQAIKGVKAMTRKFDVFLSHSPEDKFLAVELAEGLERRGVKVWEAPRRGYLVKLHRILDKGFDLEELRTLCFELGVDYDDLRGEGKVNKARELISYLDRRGRTSELVRIGQHTRDDIAWDSLAEEMKDVSSSGLQKLSAGEIINTTKSVAILVGEGARRPWEIPNMGTCLMEFVKEELPVVPVLLPGASEKPDLPQFLSNCQWVALRNGISDDGLSLLIFRIRGASDALKTTHGLIDSVTESRTDLEKVQEGQFVDSWGIASVKSQIHALSEIVVREAMSEAAVAASIYTHDALTMLVPLVVDLRWNRGYASGLVRLLDVPKSKKSLRDFQCAEVTPPCPVMEGVVSAEQDGSDQVLVRLDGNPAILVCNLAPPELQTILDSVNRYGRLGVPRTGGLSLLERIGNIPIYTETKMGAELATALFRNREALIPLIARLGMPGSEWLLPDEEEFPPIGKKIVEAIPSTQNSLKARRQVYLEKSGRGDVIEEDFLAVKAMRLQAGRGRGPQIPEQLLKMLQDHMRRQSRSG
jgi:hypothetical protein